MTQPVESSSLPTPPFLEFVEGDSFGRPRLLGSTARYERSLGELSGLYWDSASYRRMVTENANRLAYWVDESRVGEQPGALIVGMSALCAGQVGDEYFMTRGHLHARAGCAEFYYCVQGSGLLLMDDQAGRTSIAPLTPGTGVHVPGGWVHRSVNVGLETFVTLFSYDADAGQDYKLLENAGGMRKRILRDGDGWVDVDNPDFTEYDPRGWIA